MRLSSDPNSTRAPIFRTYFEGMTNGSAAHILTFLGVGLLLLELIARVFPVHHWRTPLSSLHGIRWIFQEATTVRGKKIVAVGDSALAGGGVHDHEKTLMGQLALAEKGRSQVFNLGIPAGENATSLLIIDALVGQETRGVTRVIIEVLPGEFFAGAPRGHGPSPAAVEELRRFVPFVEPGKFGINSSVESAPARVESLLQYDFGCVSAAYRDRDYLRIEEIGGFPAFWIIGTTLPERLRTAVLSKKGRGTNRLGARIEDRPFDPSTREQGSAVYFAANPQGALLAKTIDAAVKLTGKPPVILEFPMHLDYSRLKPAALAQTRSTLSEIDRFLSEKALATGSSFIRVDSETFQDPRYWTQTAAHPSTAGHIEIWRRIGPALLRALG